jgi:DUF1009 family protein
VASNNSSAGIYVSADKPRLREVPRRIGLIAGEGNFPVVLAEAARSLGVEVITFGIHGMASDLLAAHSNQTYSLKLAEVSRLIDLAHQHNITHVVMAGRIRHDLLFRQITFDKRILSILSGLKDRRADSLLGAAVAELEKEGITVLDSTMFLKSCMPEAGNLTTRLVPPLEVLEDIEFGYPLAKEIGRLDIGQTIAVKNKVVVAVEALEGTDQLIRRVHPLAGDGVVFIKVSKPRQDMRFDVPVIGLTTIRHLVAARAAALCITAGQTLFFDRPEAIQLAEQNNITIIAREDPPAAPDIVGHAIAPQRG